MGFLRSIVRVLSVVHVASSPIPAPMTLDSKLKRVDTYMDMVRNGTYTGDDRVKNIGGDVLYTQRTSLLYYRREQVGDPLAWLLLAMGTVRNGHDIISDKKKSIELWERANPFLFSKFQEHMPRTWTDANTFSNEMDPQGLYVFKPSNSADGVGVRFERGDVLMEKLVDEEGGWVVQQFITPYLFKGRKTHLRTLSIVIIQPDGEREFYQYRTMKMLVAPGKFDSDKLTGDNIEDVDTYTLSDMMLTNLSQNKRFYERNNMGKFDKSGCLLDSKDVFGKEGANPVSVSYDDVYEGVKNIHRLLYSMIGDKFMCKKSDVSVYDNSCFRIVGSDVAVDYHGNTYFLEANMAMGIRGLWSDGEISDFSNGAASLMNVPGFPYELDRSVSWEKIL